MRSRRSKMVDVNASESAICSSAPPKASTSSSFASATTTAASARTSGSLRIAFSSVSGVINLGSLNLESVPSLKPIASLPDMSGLPASATPSGSVSTVCGGMSSSGIARVRVAGGVRDLVSTETARQPS